MRKGVAHADDNGSGCRGNNTGEGEDVGGVREDGEIRILMPMRFQFGEQL
jgi:hypothetical protein